MARAQGARAQMALGFETVYGTPPVSGFTKMPFASTSLGSEQPLLNSELLIVDNATGIVEQPQLPRFKAWTNYDNYVGVGAWTKIGLNNTDYNDQGAFDAGTSLFTAPVDGTYLFGATLLYKINASATARMRGRLVLNGSTEIRGSLGEISATHVTLATAIWLQTMVPLTAGDTVELQGYFRVADGYFAADHTSFWGCKVG